MYFRLSKFAVAAANVVLLWLTVKLILGQLDWGLAVGSLLLSSFWLAFSFARLRGLFNNYFDVFSRLQVLMPLLTGAVLSSAAFFCARQPAGKGLAVVELALWGAIYFLYRRNRRNYINKGHGPLPAHSWINPPAAALKSFDLLLFSGRIATRLHESVGHGEIVLSMPDGRLMAFSSYMEKGAILNDLSEVTSARLKHGHYIALRLKEPQSALTKERAVAVVEEMLAQNAAWRREENERRERMIKALWLPAACKQKLIARFRATGYDWLGLFIGLRATNRWTCIGACLELLSRLHIKTSKYGTGLLGLGTGLLNPIMPVRFLADPSFALLTDADKAEFERLALVDSDCAYPEEKPTETMPLTLTDRTLADYLQPTKCALRAYLKLTDEPEGAEDGDAYEGLLTAMTGRLLAEQKASLPGVIDLSQGDRLERERLTKAALSAREKILFKPLLTAQTTAFGTPCSLEAQPDFLLFDEKSRTYVVRLVDSSHLITEKQLPALFARLNFCAFVLTEALLAAPARLEITDGTGKTVAVSAWDMEKLSLTLKSLLRTLSANYRPYSPVGRSKCLACPFRSACWEKARKTQDIAIIRGVDQSLVFSLRDQGIKTIAQLLDRFENAAADLAAQEKWWAGEKKPVGLKEAESILRMARAMATGQEILIRKPDIKPSRSYVMFDLEGMPEKLDPAGSIYLWGLQIFGEDACDYAPALAPFEVDGDRKGWEAFLQGAQAIFATCGDIPFVHWDRYERHRLDAYIERYGDPDGIAARVKANMLDLLAVLVESMALPLSSYSLKVVEPYVGFKRTQEEFGTTWSIGIYVEARQTADPVRRARLMDELLHYNREDLESTWAIQQWLASRT